MFLTILLLYNHFMFPDNLLLLMYSEVNTYKKICLLDNTHFLVSQVEISNF